MFLRSQALLKLGEPKNKDKYTQVYTKAVPEFGVLEVATAAKRCEKNKTSKHGISIVLNIDSLEFGGGMYFCMYSWVGLGIAKLYTSHHLLQVFVRTDF